MPSVKLVNLVYSYADEDVDFFREMKKTVDMVKSVTDAFDIQDWERSQCLPGEDLDKSTTNKFYEAHLIILLLSLDYISSDHFKQEGQIAQIRQKDGSAKIIPVLLKDIPLIQEFMVKYFNNLMMLPSKGEPIAVDNNFAAYKEIADFLMNTLQHEELPTPPKRMLAFTLDELISQLKLNIGKQFDQISVLKRGRMASVLKASDVFLNRDVTIKVINPWIQLDEEWKTQLEEAKSEMSQFSCFRHRHIKVIYSGYFDEDIKYIVLEYIHGSTLKEIIEREGKQPLWEVKKILLQICRAIYYGHQRKLIHHHINPGNVYIDDELKAVISPFKLLNTSSFVGEYTFENVSYWSPENMKSGVEITTVSDQYSIGLIAFELITGKPLFSGASIAEIIEKRGVIRDRPQMIPEKLAEANCPEELAAIIIKLLQFEPENRFSTLWAAIKCLEQLNIILGDATEKALRSYERSCAAYPKLIPQFYRKLFERRPYLEEGIFKNVNKEQQFIKLHHAINILLEISENTYQAATLSETAGSRTGVVNDSTNTLERVARAHEKINIAEADYAYFRDIFIESVAENDNEWDEDVNEAWYKLFNNGIALMVKNYENAHNTGHFVPG